MAGLLGVRCAEAQIERAFEAELGLQLGHPNGTAMPEALSNQRNGRTGRPGCQGGPQRIDVPQERRASLEPLRIPKHDRRFYGLADKVIAMHSA